MSGTKRRKVVRCEDIFQLQETRFLLTLILALKKAI